MTQIATSTAGAGPGNLALRRILDGAAGREIGRGLAVVADQCVSSATAFLATAMVARSCGAGDLGLWVLAFAVILPVQMVQRSLVSVPLSLRWPHLSAQARRQRLGSALTGAAFGWALLAGVVLAAWALPAAFGVGGLLPAAVPAMALAGLGLLVRDFLRLALLADLQVRAAAVFSTTCNVLTLGAVFYLAALGRLTLWSALAAVGFCSLCPPLAAMATMGGWASFGAGAAGDLKDSWRCGRWVLASVAARTLGIRAMPWLILAYLGGQSVGAYGAMASLANLASPAVSGAVCYLMPRLAHQAFRHGASSAGVAGLRASRFVLAVALAYALALAIWGQQVMAAVFSHRNLGCAEALSVLALAAAVEASNVTVGGLLRAVGRADGEFRGAAAASLVTLASAAALIPLAGLLGAAVAALAGQVAFAAAARRPVGRAVRKDGLQGRQP